MKTKDNLLKVELLENGNYCITLFTGYEVGYLVERLHEDDQCLKEIIERRIIDEYYDFYQVWRYEEDGNHRWEIEELENDKRVMDQYDPDYFEFLEWIKYQKYLGVSGLDPDQIERLWKFLNLRNIMKTKYLKTFSQIQENHINWKFYI